MFKHNKNPERKMFSPSPLEGILEKLQTKIYKKTKNSKIVY